jgi:hypothetical protein
VCGIAGKVTVQTIEELFTSVATSIPSSCVLVSLTSGPNESDGWPNLTTKRAKHVGEDGGF